MLPSAGAKPVPRANKLAPQAIKLLGSYHARANVALF